MNDKKSHFISVGSFLPETVLTNHDLAKIVDTSDEWITKRTGIKERRIADKYSVSDLALNAAKNCLLSIKNFDPGDLSAIIVATSTPDKNMPSVANIVQHGLCANNAFSFDLNAACSGFLYSVSVADALIKSDKASSVLIIGVDKMSKIVDWTDRNTCVLFGDGAGAMLVSSDPKYFKTDISDHDISDQSFCGIFYDSLCCDASLKSELETDAKGKITMNGRKIFETAVKKLSIAIESALFKSNIGAECIDLFIFHQANIRIIESLSKKLNISKDKVVTTIEECANTSAATIPITLDKAKKDGRLKHGNKVVLAAMGAGFTWGVCLLKI